MVFLYSYVKSYVRKYQGDLKGYQSVLVDGFQTISKYVDAIPRTEVASCSPPLLGI